jgi:hypothetical protein
VGKASQTVWRAVHWWEKLLKLFGKVVHWWEKLLKLFETPQNAQNGDREILEKR